MKWTGEVNHSNGHGSFDVPRWLSEIEATGFLSPYAPAISANFGSLSEIRRAYKEQGKEQFYKVLGVTKLGHKRLLDKAIASE